LQAWNNQSFLLLNAIRLIKNTQHAHTDIHKFKENNKYFKILKYGNSYTTIFKHILNLQSHLTESSSAVWNACSPLGYFVTLSVYRHMHRTDRLVCPSHTWPVWYQLRRVQSLLTRSKPAWWMVGSVIRN